MGGIASLFIVYLQSSLQYHDGEGDMPRKQVRREVYSAFVAVHGRPDWIADLVAEEKDLVIIGGGVAGYVAAIKAGQEGLKVHLVHTYTRRTPPPSNYRGDSMEQENKMGGRVAQDSSRRNHTKTEILIGVYRSLGYMYRKARRPRRHLSQRRLYPFQIPPQQLPSLPPGPPRHQEQGYRSW